ncbi:MAG TPA: hypothetical protein VEL75_00405 [Candidatus Methylomirabilis sp.]|nr:hypothetical protein [Candidatus Methylomirabilis sp.]
MHVSIIVREGDAICWPCKLLRSALILLLLRPRICLGCCDEIIGILSHHAARGHVKRGPGAVARPRAADCLREEHADPVASA